MTRRRPQTSISLFPFLAVLVCAMGSLILLLLVMTRKIRHEQYGSDVPSAVVDAPDGKFPDRSQEIAALEAEQAAIRRSISGMGQQVAELQQAVDAQQIVVDGLHGQFTELEGALLAETTGTDKTDAKDLQSRISNLRQKQVVLRQRLDEQEKQLLARQLRLKAVTQATAAAELKLQQVHSAIISLRQEVQKAEQVAATMGTETVVEFSNTTGTTRTPIIVEVTKEGYRIQPSGILIKPADMEGFPVSDTPLMAAILAVHRERARSSLTSQPYVLLLVRPTGSEVFYPAQGILANEKIHFGYELIDSQEQIAAGESAPTEIAAAETALDEAYRRREKIYANLRFMAQGVPQPRTSAPPDPTRRGLAIGADGTVRAESSAMAQQPSRRNYAGGVAPPPGFYERREAARAAELARSAQQQNQGGFGSQESPNETVIDQFAQHYAQSAATDQTAEGGMAEGGMAQNGMPRTGKSSVRSADAANAGAVGESEIAGSGPTSKMATEKTLAGTASPRTSAAPPATAPEYGSHDRTENMLFANGPQPLVPESASESATASHGPAPVTAEEQFAAMMAGRPSTGTPSDGVQSTAAAQLHAPSNGSKRGSRSFAGAERGSGQVNPILDVSNIDKDLLSRLPSTKNASQVYATPVGVTVFLDGHHMTVGQQPAVPVTQDSLNETLTMLLKNVETEISDARKTPHEEMMPVVKFIVSPGGERWRIPLSGSLKHLGIPNACVYELTPHIETTPEPGRANY